MDTPTRGHQALRRGRCSLDGQIYLLTFTTVGRAQTFLEPASATAAAAALHSLNAQWTSRLLCWVLMPDHWHGLLQLGNDQRLQQPVHQMKSLTARACNRVMHRSGPVWARAFHDRALRQDEDVLKAARYLVANPLRAGLVSRVGDYPYWDAVWLQDCAV